MNLRRNIKILHRIFLKPYLHCLKRTNLAISSPFGPGARGYTKQLKITPPFYIGTPDFLATFGRKSSKLMAPQKKYDFQKNSENSGTPWPPSAAGKFGHFGACFCWFVEANLKSWLCRRRRENFEHFRRGNRAVGARNFRFFRSGNHQK